MKDRVFYAVCFGFGLGVLTRSFIFIDLYLIFLLSIISLALFLFFVWISKNKICTLIAILILAFCLGIIRFQIAYKTAPVFLESQTSKQVSLSGVVVDEPEMRENNQKFTVKVGDNGDETKILITASRDDDFRYGDLVDFKGKLEKPENFLTDQGKNFDYINYLRKDGILYIMNYSEIVIVSRDNGSKTRNTLFSAKEKFLKKITT